MKKTGLLIAIVLGLTILSGCGRDSTFYSSGLKSEGAIKNDLEQSDVFWGMVAPAAPGDYHLTDVSVLARFTDEEKEDVVSISVTAQSSVATYTGVFTASYEYVEGQGFVLARIFQGDNGSYSDIKLPDDSFASAAWGMVMSEVNGTLQETSVEGMSSDDKVCKLNASFTYRDDAQHVTGEVSAYMTATFADGAWQIPDSDLMVGQSPITVVSERNTYDPANEVYWHASPYSNSVEIVNAYCSEGHQYYDRFVYYSYAAINYKEIIKYGFQTVEKNVLADDAYMGCDGAGLLGESTGPISEQDVYAYLATIKSSNPDILIITDARQYLAQVLSQPDYMRVVNEYTDEDGLHVAELATKGTDKYYKNS